MKTLENFHLKLNMYLSDKISQLPHLQHLKILNAIIQEPVLILKDALVKKIKKKNFQLETVLKESYQPCKDSASKILQD